MSARSAHSEYAVAAGIAGDADGRVADLDRRFYAFAVDRLIGWGVDVAVGLLVARTVLARDRTLLGMLAIVATIALVGLAFALLQGATGTTPGKSLAGLRLVDTGTEQPIGPGRAVVRTLVLGLAALPFGFGLAALAWTALADRCRLRRGWHDRLVSSIVLDVRPVPEVEEVEDGRAHQVVNLTALRLSPSHRLAEALEPTVPARADRRPRHAAPRSWEQTIARPDASWALTFDTGERVVVDTLLLVGRSPDPRLGEQGARLVALPSTDLSVSKTHLQVVVADDGALVVIDRGSTNGSTLVRKGAPRPLSPGRPTTLLEGDTVLFGDRRVRVERGRSDAT
ncbi:MAG TPA: RDD family protein [Nocardioides sp.]|uniref:RDD family protein n=1 Tax=Nocardioides sp. TaxID=35761 RepID=UPI002F418C59